MSALKIGLTANTLEPALNGGILDGIGIYTQALQSRLPALGIAPQAMSFPTRAVPAQRLQAMAMPRSYPAQLVLSMFGAAVRPPDSAALVHVTDYRCIRMTCPVVATLHDAIPLRYPQWASTRLRALKNALMRHAARYADKIIAVSEAAVPELIEYFGVQQDRIAVVPNGVEAAWLQPADAQAVAAMQQSAGLRSGYFLFVGTLQPRKNVGRLIQAYRTLPASIREQRQLVLVGRSGWSCDDDIAAIRQAQHDGYDVVWLNDLKGQEKLRLVYAGAGALVFPSLHEGYGIPILEAFGCGIPVACSNVSSMPEVAGGAAVEFDPFDVEAIAAAMRDAVADNDENRARIALGRQRAAALSWDNTARLTAAVYRELV